MSREGDDEAALRTPVCILLGWETTAGFEQRDDMMDFRATGSLQVEYSRAKSMQGARCGSYRRAGERWLHLNAS